MNRWFGLSIAARYVGDVHRTIGTFGRTEYGNYIAVDLGGRVYFDAERHHRVDLNVHNLFDEEYVTLIDRMYDNAGTPFVAQHLGQPQTFLLRYTYTF